MKIFILFTLVIAISYISTYFIFKSSNNSFNVSFMDRRYITILKGIAILTIIWGHVGARIGVGGIQFIAAIRVTLFLICLGYGVMQSYISKGLEKYWRKKWIKVIVPFYFLDSIFFATPSMPFLRAREMLSFPFGVVLAYIINSFDYLIHKFSLFAIMLGCIMLGLGMMFVTQFEQVKNLPYILSNVLSLFTCFPLAISIMIFINLLPRFLMNVFLNIMGVYSYEIYLVHAFSLNMIKHKISSLISFFF